MWANRIFESSAAFFASFGLTKHCGTNTMSIVNTLPCYLIAILTRSYAIQYETTKHKTGNKYFLPSYLSVNNLLGYSEYLDEWILSRSFSSMKRLLLAFKTPANLIDNIPQIK